MTVCDKANNTEAPFVVSDSVLPRWFHKRTKIVDYPFKALHLSERTQIPVLNR